MPSPVQWITLRQEAVAAPLGFFEYGRVFGRLAEGGHSRIELQIVIGAELAVDSGFHHAGSFPGNG